MADKILNSLQYVRVRYHGHTMNILLRVASTALALLLTAYLVTGIEVAGIYPALVTAIVLGVLNGIVRPVLMILTFPITILTLGLFIFVINAGLFAFAASFLDGFTVTSFWAALVGSILVSCISTAVNWILGTK